MKKFVKQCVKTCVMEEEIPEAIVERALKADGELLPKKSRPLYEKELQKFDDWRNKNSVKTVNETVLMGYFHELSEVFSPSSLWSKYSMLKTTLLVDKKIEIANYNRLEAFLKQNSKGYVPKKSRILTREDILNFFKDASNDTYLLEKVVLVMGVFGGLRRDELVKLTVDDVDDRGAVVLIKIQETKTGGAKSFTIVEENEMNALQLYRKYAGLRPKGVKERRFFLCYRNGRCTAQPVGKNTFGGVPSKVANFLGYPNAKEYTGHCLRRTSATLLVNAGADMLTLKRHGKWKSDTVAEGYIEDSMASKNKISRMIAGGDKCEVNKVCSFSENVNLGNLTNGGGLKFSGSFSNCVFNFKDLK